MTSESDQLPVLAISDHAGVGEAVAVGVGVGPQGAGVGGSSGAGTADAMGMGMKTTGGGVALDVGIEPFHSKPFPIRSILF